MQNGNFIGNEAYRESERLFHHSIALSWTQPRTLHESRLSIFLRSAGPLPLRISRSLATAEFREKLLSVYVVKGV